MTHMILTTHYRRTGVRTIAERAYALLATGRYALLATGRTHFPQKLEKGRNRLTCPAQPGHGGKRRDSRKERVSSAITKLMHVIDHNPNDLIEIKYFDITFETLEWLGASSS